MTTLRIENAVRDFEEWKAVFDKFDRFRAEKGVRAYRMSRQADDPSKVVVDMDFDSLEEATAFRGALEQIWQTPQSKDQLVSHDAPVLYEVVEQRQVSGAASSAS
jgi:hypothetical protein